MLLLLLELPAEELLYVVKELAALYLPDDSGISEGNSEFSSPPLTLSFSEFTLFEEGDDQELGIDLRLNGIIPFINVE